MNLSANQSKDELGEWFTKEQSRSLTTKILQCFSTTFVFVVIIFGNGSVLWILVRKFNLRNAQNLLLFCLILANFLNALFILPFLMVSTVTDKWIFGNTWCQLSAFFDQFLTFTSNVMATVVALHRYQVIVKTFSPQLTFRGTKWTISFVLFYALVFSLPPFFGWNTYRFSREKGFCTLYWKDGASGMVFTFLVILTCFLTPLAIMVFTYVQIAATTRHNARNPRGRPTAASVSPHSSSTTVQANARSDVSDDVSSDVTLQKGRNRFVRFSRRYLSSSRDSISDAKTMTSILYVIVTFVLFLAPYYVMNLASALSQDPLSAPVDFGSTWLYFGHSAMAAVVYGYMNRRIRPVIMRLPWCPRCPGCRKGEDAVFGVS